MRRSTVLNTIRILFLINLVLIGILFYVYAKHTPGTGRYFVLLFPEGSESKNYFVLADIDKEGELYLEKVYWPNGGYTTFDDQYAVVPIKLNKKVHITDDENRNWVVILTNIKE